MRIFDNDDPLKKLVHLRIQSFMNENERDRAKIAKAALFHSFKRIFRFESVFHHSPLFQCIIDLLTKLIHY